MSVGPPWHPGTMSDAPQERTGGEPEEGPLAPPPDPVARQDLRRFELYCRWSILLGLLSLGLVATAEALSLTAVVLPGSVDGLAAGLAVGGTVVLGVLFTAATIVASALLFRGPALPRPLAGAVGALAVALAALSPALTPPEAVYADGAGRWLGPAPWVVAAVVVVASLHYRWRPLLVGVCAAGAALLGGYVAAGHSALSAATLSAATVVSGLVFAPVGLLTWWMVDVVRRLDRARGVAAQLAVAQERLRFSRDLHDVYGRTLATLAVKSELGAEFARRGDPRAVTEMLAVRDLAQSSLTQVRGIVRGYRNIDLGEEVSGARSVLRSAGLTTRIEGLDTLTADLPPAVAEVFAWVLREAVTNTLRHAGATRVDLVGARSNGRACLRISNDVQRRSGVTGAGTGLLGLAERVEAVGGTFEAGARGAEFVVEACVPLEAAAP